LEYLGKSCEDEFCPLDSECIQLELLAHCSPKKFPKIYLMNTIKILMIGFIFRQMPRFFASLE